MGTVVPLEPVTQRPEAARTGTAKVALVLGGGGVTGGVYTVGALRALDLLAVNMTINQFDIFLGTSSGSFVAALAANGVTPEEMMRVVLGERPASFRISTPECCYHRTYRGCCAAASGCRAI
jgi:patatin-like phospholipase/acyl hydrolase